MAKLKVIVKKDGNLNAVYNDALRKLPVWGNTQPERASNVEYEDGNWVARLIRNNEVIARGPCRDEVIKQEVKVIQERLANGQYIL